MNIPSIIKPAQIVWALLLFIAGGIATPFLSKSGEKMAEIILGDKPVRVEACAPLKDARIILKKKTGNGEQIIADQRIQIINETSVFVENDTSKSIKDATLSIYPLSIYNDKPEIWFTEMFASSIAGSEQYKVERSSSAYRVKIPVLHSGEFLWVQTKFGEPIGYIVELFYNDGSIKRSFSPGCPKGSYTTAPIPKMFFSYYGDKCKKPESKGGTVECKFENTIPFEITKDMLGKEIIEEHLIDKSPT